MEYALTADNLCKRYGRFNALNNLSMRVEKGAIYGLVGKNGSGKTTLIRLICGLQRPTLGQYSIYGEKNTSSKISYVRHRMGAVIESPSIFLNMTARDNLKHQYYVLGRPSFDGIDELLQLVGLEKESNKKAQHFSLGMRQRLGIALALAGNPDFLLLDEPINGIDPQGIVQIRELLIKLNKERQMTILISSHILGELSKMATHYGFIEKGSIIKEISADDLERSCRKCMRISVSDIPTLIKVLDLNSAEYRIVSENTADIYGKYNIAEIVLMLSKENCDIISLSERDETLESYYINLVGGAKND